jgi:hypothetical protein
VHKISIPCGSASQSMKTGMFKFMESILVKALNIEKAFCLYLVE